MKMGEEGSSGAVCGAAAGTAARLGPTRGPVTVVLKRRSRSMAAVARAMAAWMAA